MRRLSRPATSSRWYGERVSMPSNATTARESALEDEPHQATELTKRSAGSPQARGIDATSRLTKLLTFADEKLREQLLIASEKGMRHAVYLLLHQGVVSRDRCRGMRGFSPLHHAAMRGHLEVLQLLVEFGWNVDIRNDAMETPLHLASYSGHVAIVEFLLDKGAEVNATTTDGDTSLFYAARKSHYRVVRLLIRRECDLSNRNRYGDVAQDEATSEKTLLEFEVGQEDLGRLYRHGTSITKPTRRAFQREITLSQTQRERILSFLDLKSLCRASQACYRWHRASDNPALWRHLGVSRWELQLQTSVGIGAVTPMSLIGVGGLQPSTTTLVGSVHKCRDARRPSSCDPEWSSVVPSRRSSLILGHPRRLQTARTGAPP